MFDTLQFVVDSPTLNLTEIAQRMSDTLQFVAVLPNTQRNQERATIGQLIPVKLNVGQSRRQADEAYRTFVERFLLG